MFVIAPITIYQRARTLVSLYAADPLHRMPDAYQSLMHKKNRTPPSDMLLMMKVGWRGCLALLPTCHNTLQAYN